MGFADGFNQLVKEYLNAGVYEKEHLSIELYNRVEAIAKSWLYSRRKGAFSPEEIEEIVNDVAWKVLTHIAVEGNEEICIKWVLTVIVSKAGDYHDWRDADKRGYGKEVTGDDEFWNLIDSLQSPTGKVNKNKKQISTDDAEQNHVDASEKKKKDAAVSANLRFEEVLFDICMLRAKPDKIIAYILKISREAVFNGCYDMELKRMKEIVHELSDLVTQNLSDTIRKEEIQKVLRREFANVDFFYAMKTVDRIFDYVKYKDICDFKDKVEPLWEEMISKKKKSCKEMEIIYELVNPKPIEEVLNGKTLFEATSAVKNVVSFVLQKRISEDVFKGLDERLNKKNEAGEIIGNTPIQLGKSYVKDISYIKGRITNEYILKAEIEKEGMSR